MLTSGGGMRPQAGDVHLHLAFPQLYRLRANRAVNGAAGAMGTRQVHAFCQDNHDILASVNIIWYCAANAMSYIADTMPLSQKTGLSLHSMNRL